MRLIIKISAIFLAALLRGQDRPIENTSGTPTTTVQPKIMVIPYVKEGEDLRNVLEQDINKRIALTKIKEAFDSRGFTTVDFIAKLKAAKDNSIFTSDNQADVKSQIIQLSGADIFVEAETNISRTSGGTSVNLVLSSYESSTGNSLSNKVGESGKFYTDDIAKLTTKASESVMQDFLNVMQSKFTDIVNNGKSILMEIGFAQDSQYKMSSEVGTDGLPLSDQIEIWMENNAYKNNYHIQGTTDLKMIFDDIRIPLKDNAGKNYNSNKFALEIFKFLKSLNFSVEKDIKGNTIYITIK